MSDPRACSTGVPDPNRPGVLGIDWAQGTVRGTSCEDVRAWLGEIFGPAAERPKGWGWYARSWSLGDPAQHVIVADTPVSSSSVPGEVYVEIPGGALAPLGWDGQVRVLVLLDSIGVRLSRVDVAYDDLARVTDPADVLAAIEAGNTRTRTRAWRSVRDHKGGMTTYIGSRLAECFVRVYRKWAESNDPTQGTRWEMEAKGERAPIVAALMRSAPRPAETYLELLRLHADFVDRSGGERAERAPLLAWWSALIGSAGRATLTARVVVIDTLARKTAWMLRSVAPTLALLFAARGSSAVNAIIDAGWSRARFDLLAVTP